MKKFSLANRTISTERPAFVMGIVNATPDSFWEGSRGGIDQALRLIDEGADILDIGGESTRPGSSYVDEDEEIRRVVPLISEIRKLSSIALSVDTRKSRVMQAALDAGADILNDVSALEDDELMAALCAKSKIPVILMHKRGVPLTMQQNGSYNDVLHEVSSYLQERAAFAEQAGIEPCKIIVDPGIGFGKNTDANVALIRHCGQLCEGRYPVLMALSRKTVIGEITGEAVSGRLFGTLAANLISVIAGASMIRVHDVKPAVDSMAVLEKIGYTKMVASQN